MKTSAANFPLIVTFALSRCRALLVRLRPALGPVCAKVHGPTVNR